MNLLQILMVEIRKSKQENRERVKENKLES